jgi:hypothetical protein
MIAATTQARLPAAHPDRPLRFFFIALMIAECCLVQASAEQLRVKAGKTDGLVWW